MVKFIKQKTPFCVVCTNSNLGPSKFIAYLDSAGRQETREMTKEDIVTLRQGITQQLYNLVNLGAKGIIYEFKERPYRDYCERNHGRPRCSATHSNGAIKARSQSICNAGNSSITKDNDYATQYL
jgi:hypothetical protein